MEHQPFSVAMSVYKNDNPAFFDRALESITYSQTIKPNEIVIVVDGPVPDEINSVIAKYEKDFKIVAIRLEQNGGLGNALKIATENCSNELIARMDSDDISVPTRFEQQLNCFESNHNIDVVGGDIAEFVNQEDNVVAKRVVPIENNQIKKYMRKRCAMNHVSVMYKKESIFKAGGYLDWYFNEDYYLWIRMMLSNAVFSNTGTVLVNVRTGQDMYCRRGGYKYFLSEKNLQKFMLTNHIISFVTYLNNIFKRFIVQIVLPNKVRGWVFRHVARKTN